MNDQKNTVSVLFVCLGNICRSPSAHGLFQARVDEAGLTDRIRVDSAGTGDWHIGKAPDARATAAAAERGIAIESLRARQVSSADLTDFDYVLAMDDANLGELEQLARTTSHARRAHVALFSDYSQGFRGQSVPDPYFGGDQGFENVLDMIDDSATGLLAEIRESLTIDAADS